MNDTNRQPNNFQMANEAGIGGFIFALVLPLYQVVYLPNGVPRNMFNSNPDSKALWTFVALMVFALILSIIGVSKSSKKYQKGIAFSGLFFNLAILLNLVRQMV